MKHIDFKLGDKTYALSFTAEALFTLYDKFGVTGDILGTTHILEPTAEGWKNCCWLAALMASQGELQRRYMGENTPARGYDLKLAAMQHRGRPQLNTPARGYMLTLQEGDQILSCCPFL